LDSFDVTQTPYSCISSTCLLSFVLQGGFIGARQQGQDLKSSYESKLLSWQIHFSRQELWNLCPQPKVIKPWLQSMQITQLSSISN